MHVASRPRLMLACFLAACAGSAAAETAVPPPAAPTECDRLAAHPSDPDKAATGVSTAEVRGWNDAAIWACRRAVADAPGDARQRYQLGRALFYSGRAGEALDQLAIAATGTYRQAQFVLGLMYTDGVPEILEADSCKALELWKDAASRGHFAARIALGRDWARGAYRQCADLPEAAQVDAWLAEARAQGADYYQRLLIDWAREEVSTGR